MLLYNFISLCINIHCVVYTIAYIALHNPVHCIAQLHIHCIAQLLTLHRTSSTTSHRSTGTLYLRINLVVWYLVLLLLLLLLLSIWSLCTRPSSTHLAFVAQLEDLPYIIMNNPGSILYTMFYASSSSKWLDDAPRYVCVCSKYSQGQSHMVSDTTWRRHLQEARTEDEGIRTGRVLHGHSISIVPALPTESAPSLPPSIRRLDMLSVIKDLYEFWCSRKVPTEFWIDIASLNAHTGFLPLLIILAVAQHVFISRGTISSL